jgi:hypothetical protein
MVDNESRRGKIRGIEGEAAPTRHYWPQSIVLIKEIKIQALRLLLSAHRFNYCIGAGCRS